MSRRDVELLLVEDNPIDVLLTKEALKEAKIANNLHVVEDGEEAMTFLYQRGKYINAPRPDLILLDLNLPKKSGREVLADLKNDERLKTIPTLILSTSQSERDIRRAYDLHANCYITKPVDFEEFMDIVKSIDQFWFSTVTLPSVQQPPGTL